VWLALTSLLGMSTWFSGTAVIGPLREAWALTPAQGSWLTIAVQLGFVTGALVSALTNLVDLVPARGLMVLSAIAAAAANAGFAMAPGPALGLPLRFLTGVFLAGVYPTGLKLMATWFRADRGRALGIMVGSLTLGSAAPHLVRGLSVAYDWRAVVTATSWLTIAGAAVGWLAVREGPYAFPRARFDPAQAGRVLRDRGVRLACIGYFGHMWELYAMWGWVAVFLSDALARKGAGAHAPVWAFAAIAAGFAGSWWAGIYSDRAGRTTSAALVVRVRARHRRRGARTRVAAACGGARLGGVGGGGLGAVLHHGHRARRSRVRGHGAHAPARVGLHAHRGDAVAGAAGARALGLERGVRHARAGPRDRHRRHAAPARVARGAKPRRRPRLTSACRRRANGGQSPAFGSLMCPSR